MKQIIKDVLFGILIFMIIMILEFIVTLPFGVNDIESLSIEEFGALINQELLLVAIPAGIVTYLFAMLLKTATKQDAMRRSILWTGIIAIQYVSIGIGNDNIGIILSSLGFYAVVICAFAGPMIYAKIKHYW